MFRLALALGAIHPDYLRARLTAQQIEDWWEYSLVEPFGEWNEWARNSRLIATIVNVNRSSKSSAVSPEEFMPKFGEDLKTSKLDRIKAAAENLVSLGLAKKKKGN